ncbi:hypothetical protein MS3_00004972 [Schistosoma haematobium]|uniref:Cyclic nucleotide-binding domain-containing protein n=1 Tax=Schistosoma haematobium TaxID=6185 RepID=A0A922LJ60_SCHHA|nr:hypothetical protein MS3_00004972 [Schistosoma haematobium]KAH9587114.1 hypothetical protein MS3_00004972 [Schistosoma haematobium]CAH8539842.1 unnamed protein product [Schistosoma haematobium]CAH8544168.1 unnamed protein product [Schistosoma haematobium]
MQQPLSNNLVEVLIKPNNMRTAIEIRHIALWFKENILALKDVSIEILMKLVAECKAEFKYPHDIIIREGDIGDCMYILLSGRVSVHYRGDQSAVKNEEMHELMNVKSNSFIPVKQNVSDIINQELGPQVGQLEAGSVFGEVALIEDCLRTASILALPNTIEVNRHESSLNQQQQSSSSSLTKQSEKQSVCLVNISRTLYNNTVRVAMENEFHERMKFVKNIIYFQHLSDKIQKQIAMSLEKQKYEYNQVVLKQGSSFNGLYFVYRGELRVTLHVKQSQTSTTYRNNYRSIKYDLPLITGSNPNTPEKTGSLCIGDIEFLLKYPNYLFTIISNTSYTILYYMNIKNAERYFYGLHIKFNYYELLMIHLTMNKFSQFIQLRLQNFIDFLPNHSKMILVNLFNNLINNQFNQKNYEKINKNNKKLKNNFNLINLNQTFIHPYVDNNNNKLLNEKNNQKTKQKQFFCNFSNKINKTLNNHINNLSLNNLIKVDQNLLNIDYLPLNSINQFIEILQSNLPYSYKLNAGRLLQQLDNYKLQIKIDNFIKNLNELKLNQLNENNTQLNYYTTISEQTHELEKSSLMAHKRRLPPSFVGMCNWFPNM